MAILVVTHDLGLAWNIADRVAVMYLGRIVEQGTTEELLDDPRHPYTRALLSVVPEIAPARAADPHAARRPTRRASPPAAASIRAARSWPPGEAARLGIDARCRGEDLALAPVADAEDLLVACHAVAGAAVPA